jgi:hypothetical protein
LVKPSMLLMEKGVLIFEKCERWFRRDVPEDKKMTSDSSSEFQKAFLLN